jgi:hypothetical protein
MFYKALGFAVWQGVKWYLGRGKPSRKAMVAGGAGAAALGVAASLLALGSKRKDG